MPRPTGREMVRFLERQGFQVVRIRGSHHIMECGPSRTNVPIHAGQPLKIGTLHGILRDVGWSHSEFESLWHA